MKRGATEAGDRPIDGHIRLPKAPPPRPVAAESAPLLGDPAPHARRDATNPSDLLDICWSLLTARDLDGAAEVLEIAKGRGVPGHAAEAMEATLRWLQGDWPELRRLAEQVIARSER